MAAEDLAGPRVVVAGAGPARLRQRFVTGVRRYWLLYLLIAPVLIYFAIFVFYPMGQGVFLSMQKAGLLGPRGFVGLDNYAKIFATPNVWQATVNTLLLAAGITVFGTLLPLIPAIALAEIVPVWLKRSLQTVIYTPYLLSWVIIIGIWANTLSPIGLVNSTLMNLGLIGQPILFFAHPDWARPLVVAQTVWRDMGFHALIYFAALISMNPDIIDSAELDGANGWQKIRDHVLPHLKPMIAVVFLIILQGSLHTFDSAFLMLNGRTAEQITTLSIYSYQRGLLQFDLGMASATGVVLLVLCLAVAAVTRLLLPNATRI
jgi:putative aldouronate transport system permease protein